MIKKENQQIRSNCRRRKPLHDLQGASAPRPHSLPLRTWRVNFEATTASGAERFYRRTLDKLRLKLLESRLVHTVTLKQTECRKRNKNSFQGLQKERGGIIDSLP